MLPILLLLLDGAGDAIAAYRRKTTVERSCVTDPHSTDLTICGRRRADRFRVPFVGPAAGDRGVQHVSAERNRLLYRRTPVQDLSPFLVGGGLAGAHVSTRGGVGPGEARKPAP